MQKRRMPNLFLPVPVRLLKLRNQTWSPWQRRAAVECKKKTKKKKQKQKICNPIANVFHYSRSADGPPLKYAPKVQMQSWEEKRSCLSWTWFLWITTFNPVLKYLLLLSLLLSFWDVLCINSTQWWQRVRRNSKPGSVSISNTCTCRLNLTRDVGSLASCWLFVRCI